MRRVHEEHLFEADPEALWAVYTDHGRWERWAGLGPSRLLRPGEVDRDGVGAIRSLGPGPFAARERVTVFEPPRRMAYRLIGGGLPLRDHEGSVELQPEGARTRIVWQCRFAPGIPGTGWLLERAVARVFRRALAGLERHCFPAHGAGER